MNNQNLYRQYLELVEKRINEHVQVIEPKSLYEPFSYFMQAGGKRIRPVLTMISAGAVGGNPEEAVDIAAAIEILHNFTLVHDDIMDDSPLRRGRPTVHNKWDKNIAILVGDLMIGYACKLLPTHKQHERAAEIHKEFTDSLIIVSEGQAFDMDFNEKRDTTVDEYFVMISKKTAHLLEASAVVGGHAGFGSNRQIAALGKYGDNLGLAFQIQDDLLDLTADQAELGKQIGQDIVEGKKTYMMINARLRAQSPEDKKLIDLFFENHGLGSEYVPVIKDMLDRLGILDDAKVRVKQFLNEAEASLEVLEDNEYTRLLKWIIQYLTDRKY
ncbi:MAG: polyprenyl synthetase family protein [Candidatus Kapaibacterium sp.]